MNETQEIHTTRFMMRVEFDGTDFVGWQFQENGRSVQEVIEEALFTIVGMRVRVHGSGRTDAGVHATGQIAHVDLRTSLSAATLNKALHAYLPADVTIHAMEEVPQDFHARHSASSREYVYTISHRRVSLDRRRQWILFASIDHDAVRAAIEAFRGTHDFTTFSKYTPDKPHHFCHVFDICWETDGVTSRLYIKANRFLHGMVRCIMGALVLVGRRKLQAGDISRLLDAKDRSLAPMLAPAHGLVLERVNYDPEERAVIDVIKEQLRAGLDPSTA